MAQRRGGRVPRPATKGEWDLLFRRKECADGWDKLCAINAEAAARAWDYLKSTPRDRTDRNHPLKSDLATVEVGGVMLEQWQHEATGAGRIWFAIDDDNKVIWFTHVATGHPKKTE